MLCWDNFTENLAVVNPGIPKLKKFLFDFLALDARNIQCGKSKKLLQFKCVCFFCLFYPVICHWSVVNKLVQNHLTFHMWVLWLFSCCFLCLCSLTSSLTSSLLFMLNCWTSRCAGEPHHSLALCFISLVLHCPSSVSSLPSPPSPPSSTLNLFPFPLPCLYICLSSLFPLFLTSLLLLPSHISPSSPGPHLCRCWQPI